MQLVEGVVEVARLRRRFAAHLHAKRLHLGGQFVDAVSPLIQERDQIRPRFAEQLHRQGGFLRTIGHRFETLGQIKQDLIGRTQRAVLVLEFDAYRREVAGGVLRSGRGLQHRGGELAQPLLKGLAGHAGLFGRRFPDRQGFDADAHTLRHLIQRIAGVDGRFHHRRQARNRYGHAKVGEHAVDTFGGVRQATQAALDRVEGGLGLVDGTDQDLRAVVCHQTFSSSF